MPNSEKVIKGLEWILQDDRFGFGENWTEDSEPKSEEEQAGYNITMAINLLKEQDAVTIKKTKEPYGYGVYGGICPKCRNWIQSAHSFCGFCGQAVKWEG